MSKKIRKTRVRWKTAMFLVIVTSLLGTSYGYWSDGLKIETNISTGTFKARGELGAVKNEKNNDIDVTINLEEAGTVAIGDIQVESATLTLRGVKIKSTSEWYCRHEKWLGGWVKNRCIYLHKNNLGLWEKWHGKGIFSECEPSNIEYVTPDPKKTLSYPSDQGFSIDNEIVDLESGRYTFRITGIEDDQISSDFTYVEEADLKVVLKCSSLPEGEGWTDTVEVELPFIYTWPSGSEEKDINTLDLVLPEVRPSLPSGGGAGDKPSEPEVVLPETRPSQPEVGLPEVELPETKPSEPEVELPETKPSEPEVVLPETEPSEPEVVLPETKPSEPEVVLPETKPSEPEVVLPETKPSEPEVVLPETKPSEPEVELPEVEPSEPEVGLPEADQSEPVILPEEVLIEGGLTNEIS